MTIFEFAKLSQDKKEQLLHTKAMLLESYIEKNIWHTVYYLPSFFIEVNTCTSKQQVMDIIPYRRGHKIEKEKDELYQNFYNKYLLVA